MLFAAPRPKPSRRREYLSPRITAFRRNRRTAARHPPAPPPTTIAIDLAIRDPLECAAAGD